MMTLMDLWLSESWLQLVTPGHIWPHLVTVRQIGHVNDLNNVDLIGYYGFV